MTLQSTKSIWARLGRIVLIVASIGVALWVASVLLFPVHKLHTKDITVVAKRMRIDLEQASDAEGYFMQAMRVPACWVRVTIPTEKFDSFVRANQLSHDLKQASVTIGDIRKEFGDLEGDDYQGSGRSAWVADDFEAKFELRGFAYAWVFGDRTSVKGVVFGYAKGCPRDTDVRF